MIAATAPTLRPGGREAALAGSSRGSEPNRSQEAVFVRLETWIAAMRMLSMVDPGAWLSEQINCADPALVSLCTTWSENAARTTPAV